MSKGFDYSKFDKIGDSDESSDDEDWKLTDAERKAKREKKRDELIEQELASHKAIEEKLKRAEKLPPRRSDDDGPTPEAPAAWSDGRSRDEKDPAKLRERLDDAVTSKRTGTTPSCGATACPAARSRQPR